MSIKLNSRRITLAAMFLALSVSGFAEEKTVSWTASGQGFGNGEKLDEVRATIDEKTSVIFYTGSGSNPPAYYDNGNSVRLYAGNSMTVRGEGIIGITLTFGSGDKTNAISANCGSYSSDGVWTGKSNVVTFTVNGTSGQRRIATISVTYETEDPDDPDDPDSLQTVYSIQEFKSLSEGTSAQLYLSDTMNARVIHKTTGEVYLRDKTGAICLTLDDTLYNPIPAHNQHVAGYMTGSYETEQGLPLFVATDLTKTEYMLFADQVSEPDTEPEQIDVEEFGAYYADWVTLTDMHVNHNGEDVTVEYDDMYFNVVNRFGLTEDDFYSTPPDGSTVNITGIAIPSDTTEQIAPLYIDPYLPIEVVALPPSHKKGDVNEDGKVDISDIVAVINIIAEGDTISTDDPGRLEAVQEVVKTVEPAGPPADPSFKSLTIYFVNGTTVTLTIEQIESITYVPDIGMKIHLSGTGLCLDFLYSQIVKIEYVYEEEILEDNNVNANWKDFDLSSTVSGNLRYAYRIEYPHLNSNQYSASNPGGNQVVVKETSDYGITYSLEWDNALIANRWTCYTLHARNLLQNVKRNDAFKVDPDVDNCAQLGDYSSSGYSRGHLCPSADRLCTREQNSQTFFLTNMQPQWQSHNGGLWERMEELVRNWGGDCDTLYVVKAATIGDVTIDGNVTDGVYSFKCNGRLPVPRYFYMAVLAYSRQTDSYEALGLWTIHENATDSNKNYGDYAITIDELERRTGIDFFCNLPDNVENKVESTLNLSYWGISKTSGK